MQLRAKDRIADCFCHDESILLIWHRRGYIFEAVCFELQEHDRLQAAGGYRHCSLFALRLSESVAQKKSKRCSASTCYGVVCRVRCLFMIIFRVLNYSTYIN